jgi:hypothetical protein
MTRTKSFETAAARRRKDPIVWTIDGVDVTLRSTMDLAEISPLTTELSKNVSPENMTLELASEKRKQMINIVERFLDPGSIDKFRTVSADLDFGLLNEMLTDLIGEYTGAPNPTPEQ